ncbi:MAG TPA: DUF3168 domain-containing protein [Mycobacterium sp.]|nr:DUF3168 domain-containing protein [Mycobacterium sp.]
MSALGGIYTALKTLIATDATIAALLANAPFSGAGGSPNTKAVYDDGAAPQNGSFPYITIGAGTSTQASSLGARGWNCTIQVKPIAQSTATGQALVTALSALLMPVPPRTLTVSGLTSCWVDDFNEQPPLIETIAGVPTRSVPIIVRVYAT